MTRQQSGAHDFVGDGPLVSFFEGMVLGNGDLGAIMYGNQFELKFNLGKNDVWDARFDSDAEADILKHDDLIKLIEEYGVEAFRSGQTGNLGPGQPTWMMNPVGKKAIALDVRTVYATPAFYENGRYCRPCPKRVGEVVFVGPGLNTTPMKSCLSIEEGVISVEFRYNDHTSVRLEGFIWAESNIFCLRVEVKGDLQWGGWAKLIMRKWPDAVDASIPDPVLETPFERIVTLTQEIPGDDAVDPFSWTLAAVAPGSRMDQRYESIISLPKEGAVADHFFAVATSRDSHDPKRAIELAIQAHTQGYDVLQASQKEWWSSFWQRSSVELEDKELESAWYRDLYLLACNLKEGKQAPGLFGNMTTWDASMWHSDYHMGELPKELLPGPGNQSLRDVGAVLLGDRRPLALRPMARRKGLRRRGSTLRRFGAAVPASGKDVYKQHQRAPAGSLRMGAGAVLAILPLHQRRRVARRNRLSGHQEGGAVLLELPGKVSGALRRRHISQRLPGEPAVLPQRLPGSVVFQIRLPRRSP